MKCQADAIQWGGGSSRIFPWSPKPTRFSGGGSTRIFPWSPKPTRFSGGGGVVAQFFRLWGPFTFLGFPKGGARAPQAPPESATVWMQLYRQNCGVSFPGKKLLCEGV